MSAIVIAGGGLAAQRCVETLRARGHDGPITMVCGETRTPYDRPPLSKAVLAGDPAAHVPGRPTGTPSNGIELRLGNPARRLEPDLAGSCWPAASGCAYDRLLIATGARPGCCRHSRGCANVAGAAHARRRAAAARRAARRGALAIVGAGLIGQEVARRGARGGRPT